MPTAKATKAPREAVTKLAMTKMAKSRTSSLHQTRRSSKVVAFSKNPSDPSIFALITLGLSDQIHQVRNGLPAAFVAEMSEALSMPRASYLDSLQLPRSTIESRIKNKKPLTSTESDAVLRTAKALAKAEAVFEDRDAAAKWFKRDNRSLGGVAPVSLMDTEGGIELVMQTLGRIEYGVVA